MSEIKYRVREKHTPTVRGRIWGENLTKAEADKLKDKVAATNKSRTARVEPMDHQPVLTDPVLTAARAKATRAAAPAAAAAQARHDALRQKTPALVPVPDFDTGDLGDDDLDDDLEDGDGEELTPEDLAAVGEIPPVTEG